MRPHNYRLQRYMNLGLPAFLLVAGQLEVWLGSLDTSRPGVAAVSNGIMAGALLWRKTHPTSVAAIVGAVLAMQATLGATVHNGVTFLVIVVVAMYSAGAYARTKESIAGLAVVSAGAALDVTTTAVGGLLDDYLYAGFVLVTSWLAGRVSRRRQQKLFELGQEAEELRQAQENRARRAAAAERDRIARELHDIIAHSLSVILVQAGGAEQVLEKDPVRARQALASVQQTGRQALGEMRLLLGLVREQSEQRDLAPQPGMDDIRRLVDDIRATGLNVDVTVLGDRLPLSPGLQLAAYRVTQEALTNTLKHSSATNAQVRLTYAPDKLMIEVADNGSSDGSTRGAGHGLAGMRERVSIYGGQLEAGRDPDGGFLVRARFPLSERVA